MKIKLDKNFFAKYNKLLFVALFALIGVTYLIITHAAVPSVPAGYTEVFVDDFNNTALDTSKWNVISGTEGNSQSYYRSNNVSVSNGSAVLRTRRHCVNATTDTLDDTNASTAACPSGKITVYSSGQIRTGNIFPSAGRIEIRAKLPTAQVGLWPALWTRNQSSWCTTNYGELDIMEWYAELPKVNTSTSHITCANNATKKLQHNDYTITEDLSNNFHVWSMDWSENGVKYYMDGVLLPHVATQGDSDRNIDSYADFSGVTQAQFSTILNQLWQLRINTQVISPGDSYHPAPDNTKPFQDASYLIDYVRVLVPDGTTPPPPPPPSTLATVTGLSATAQDGKVTLSWDEVQGADNYTVKWGTGGAWTNYSNDTSNANNPTTPTYTVTGLTNGVTYNFAVAARDSSGTAQNGDYSSTITSTPTAPPVSTKLGTVSNLVSTAGNGQVVLNWDAVSGANNYTVRWGTGGTWTYYSNSTSNSNNPTTNTYTVTGLNNGTKYNFSVAARDSTGTYQNGDYSTGVNSTPQAPVTAKPGDTDGDGDVDLADLARLLSEYGKTGTFVSDLNKNGSVDLTDLAILLSNYGK